MEHYAGIDVSLELYQASAWSTPELWRKLGDGVRKAA